MGGEGGRWSGCVGVGVGSVVNGFGCSFLKWWFVRSLTQRTSSDWSSGGGINLGCVWGVTSETLAAQCDRNRAVGSSALIVDEKPELCVGLTWVTPFRNTRGESHGIMNTFRRLVEVG